MSFKNDGTLKKRHMTNTPPEIDKYGTHKKMATYQNDPTKNGTVQKCHTLQKDA